MGVFLAFEVCQIQFRLDIRIPHQTVLRQGGYSQHSLNSLTVRKMRDRNVVKNAKETVRRGKRFGGKEMGGDYGSGRD